MAGKREGDHEETRGSDGEALDALMLDLGGEDPRVAVERRGPNPGWMDVVSIPPDEGAAWLCAFIRERWGPGHYRIRPYGLFRDGKTGRPRTGYRPGQATVQIAALPGVPIPASTPVSSPIVVQSPPAANNGLTQELLRALLDPRRREPNAAVLELVGKFMGQPAPVAPSSSITELERAVALIERVQKGRSKPEDEDDEKGLYKLMLVMLATRILGGDPPQVQQQRGGGRQQVRAQAARPNPAPAKRPAPTGAEPVATSTAAPAAPAPDEDEDDEEAPPLEDEVVDHITELASDDPNAAVEFMAEILGRLPSSVTNLLAGMGRGNVVNLGGKK